MAGGRCAGLLLVLASGFMFSGAVDRVAAWTGFAMTLPPLLLWAAMRFGTLGASTALLLVSVIATNSTNTGQGPFTNETPGDNTLLSQLFILGTGVPLLGLAVVLTEQQRTRAALEVSHTRLRGLSRELIAAREDEGTRIARELHDDVGQRLALVMVGLSRLRRSHPERSSSGSRPAQSRHSLRQISHQLHPAALEHAGLAAALELTCVEVGQATGLMVRLAQEGETIGLPPEVALCLYRVAQEALANVVRHAGARRVVLVLRRGTNGVDLEITDDGRGLGAAAAGEAARGARAPLGRRAGGRGGRHAHSRQRPGWGHLPPHHHPPQRNPRCAPKPRPASSPTTTPCFERGSRSCSRGTWSSVATVSNGWELVEETRRLQPDLVVADWTMPQLADSRRFRSSGHERLQVRFVMLDGAR